jgi:hypothetical protein
MARPLGCDEDEDWHIPVPGKNRQIKRRQPTRAFRDGNRDERHLLLSFFEKDFMI